MALNYSQILKQGGGIGVGSQAINTAGALQGLRDKRFNLEQKQNQVQAQSLAQTQDQENRAKAAELLTNGTPDQIAEFGIQNPLIMKDVINAANFKDDQAMGSRVDYYKSVLSGSVEPRVALTDRIRKVELSGGDASGLKQTLQGSDEDIIEAARKDYSVMDSEGFLNYRKATGADNDIGTGKLGTVSPKDFTVESMEKYQSSGSIKDLVRYSPKTVKVAGVEHSLNPITQKWEPIVDATSNQLTDQAKAISKLEADAKSRIDFGKSKVKWKTGRPKFKSKINSSKASQKILEATSKQLKDNINSWSTKYGASLSSLPGSEARRLKNQLNTLKAHSAFSTLTDLKDSGGTLGAISEAELVLLEAKLGALDQGGDSTELLRVIDQIVNSNISTIGRLETEFYNTDAMYKGGFDDLEESNQEEPETKTANWADL